MDDLARWAAALTTMVGLGLTLGLNPALYGATADMLAQNTRVPARMGWMVGGLATGATILYLLLQSFDPTEFVAAAERSTTEAVLGSFSGVRIAPEGFMGCELIDTAPRNGPEGLVRRR